MTETLHLEKTSEVHVDIFGAGGTLYAAYHWNGGVVDLADPIACGRMRDLFRNLANGLQAIIDEVPQSLVTIQ